LEKTIFLKNRIEVLVVSAGGVGTTFLMDAIGQYKTVNNSSNLDGYKHLPIPPISFNPKIKVIYVFGDPVLASISLFRRNYHHAQSKWATKFQEQTYIIPENLSLEDYALNHEDGHYFEKHFHNWRHEFLCYPSLFLKYSAIHESLDDLSLFLELPESFAENFPEKKPRKSSLEDLDDKIVGGLREKYTKYKNEVNNLPNYFIVDPRRSIQSLILDTAYRKALSHAFYKKFSFIRKLKNKLS